MSEKIIFGSAKEIITPAIPMSPMGFGCTFGKPFKNVHDDLYVRALMLRDEDGEAVVFVAFDLLFHDQTLATELRKYVSEKYEVPTDNLHISFTHTHFGPAVKGYDFTHYKEEYEKFITDRARYAIDRAFLSTFEGKLKYSTVSGDWNISRRLMQDGKMRCRPNPAGEYDGNLYLFRLEDEEGAIRALAVNFACHPSNLDDKKYHYSISSEYPGRLCQKIESELYGCNAIFFQGFGADAKLRRAGSTPPSFRGITPEECDEVASSMAHRIKNKIISNDWKTLPVKLGSKLFTLSLPLEAYPKEKYEEFLNFYTNVRYSDMMIRNCKRVLDNFENEPDALALDCGVVRINPDFYILSMGGEPGINIATVLRQAIPDKTLVCFGYSSSVAYVPSDKMILEGGYEAEDSVSEYRLKGRIKLGVDKIFSDGFRCAIDEINKK